MEEALYNVVVAHRAKQLAIVRRATELVAANWSRVDQVNPVASWSRQMPQVVGLTRTAMRLSATGSTDYVSATMAAQGVQPAPSVSSVVPDAFAQTAADGRALGGLLFLPAVTARTLSDSGQSSSSAWSSAGDQLGLMVATEVADAGRLAVGAAMLADRRVAGYFREPGPSACARCAILAGIWADTYEGAAFERHPRCQCTAVPAAERLKSNPTAPTPRGYFDSLSQARQDATFGKAPAQAIRDGADPGAVINARRGMSAPGFNWTTTEGTSRRGLYGGYSRAADGSLTKLTRAQSRALPPRLTPAAIYRLSSSREEAVAMLRKYGYIT